MTGALQVIYNTDAVSQRSASWRKFRLDFNAAHYVFDYSSHSHNNADRYDPVVFLDRALDVLRDRS
jgi:hypothetical protein